MAQFTIDELFRIRFLAFKKTYKQNIHIQLFSGPQISLFFFQGSLHLFNCNDGRIVIDRVDFLEAKLDLLEQDPSADFKALEETYINRIHQINDDMAFSSILCLMDVT